MKHIHELSPEELDKRLHFLSRGYGAASGIAEVKTNPKTGKDYPVIKDKAEYAKLPHGKTYFHGKAKKFFVKGKVKGKEA